MSGTNSENAVGSEDDMTDTTSASPDIRVTNGPTPTEEEAVAIVAALQVVLASGGAPEAPEPAPPRWRFSGRWWSKPVATRRDRPSLF